MILNDQDDVLPPPSRLDAAVANLARAGDHRHLITYVERWATYAEPSRLARLAQAQAFLELRQVDRAWIRLKDLVDDPHAPLPVLLTAARLFLVRGWPSQAREVLTRALADHPDDRALQGLWDQASSDAIRTEPPTQPDAEGPEAMLPVAEHYLATGQTGNGRQLLERLRKAYPNHPRVTDLLWGMQGDFDAGPSTLATLTERYAPSLASLRDMADEHTESVTQEDVKHLLGDEPEATDGNAFPDLFRSPAPKEAFEDEITEEITRTAEMLTPELRPAPEDPDTTDGERGDTRIVRVVNRAGPGPGVLMHRDSPRPDNDFDLGEYRREMGMTAPPLASHLASDFGADLEEEDDDLVVLTRRERPAASEADVSNTDPTMSQIGREVAHLVGGRPPRTPEPPPSVPAASAGGEPIPVPDGTPAPLGAMPAPVLDDLDLDPDTDDVPPPRRASPTFVWLAVLVLVLVFGVGAVAALALGIALF